jgi:hypothetical protein
MSQPTTTRHRHANDATDTSHRLAEVTFAEAGLAQTVIDLETGATETIIGHMSGVPALAMGDTVGITRYPQGPVVTGRLRATGEHPAAAVSEADGHLALSADQSITLRVGESVIELHADGTVRIDGIQMEQVAETRLGLRSASLELN